MAVTLDYQPNSDAYDEVVSGTTNDFLLEVNGPGPAIILWASSQPASNAKGHLLTKGSAITRGGLTEKVWARGVNGPTNVIVTEE